MQVHVRTTPLAEVRADQVVIALRKLEKDSARLPRNIAAFDRAHGGIVREVVARGGFDGSAGQCVVVYPSGRSAPKRILLVGLGDASKIDADTLRMAAGTAARRARDSKAATVAMLVPRVRKVRGAEATQALAEGAVLGAYRFDRYKQEKSKPLRSFTLLLDAGEVRTARAGAARGRTLAESQNVARDLSNEPPNELPPAALASAARKVAREAGLRCRVLDVPQMKKLGMEAILAVGGGSSRPPRMIVLEHLPKRRTRRTPTLCIVGKGVTFDTGGISLKPAAAMHEMKHDMSGAAAVVGAMRAAGLLGLDAHVVGVVGAAENMPGGKAYRPGDVVGSMSGKTIEILNTDAEGRVVLADALFYAAKTWKPDAMVDLATLTGACVVALGPWATGLFSHDLALRDELVAAGETAAERIWPMPLLDEHAREMRSDVADLKNAGGRNAGASTAAGFLSAFAGDGPWAHLDIAGTAWGTRAEGYHVKGATGVGVRALVAWLEQRRR